MHSGGMMKKKIEQKKRNSIKDRFMLAFLLFGLILVLLSVAIQNDLAEASMESQIITEEERQLDNLEYNLGNGPWHVENGALYKGDTLIGDGIPEHANQDPFIKIQVETGTFVYCMIYGGYASEEYKNMLHQMGMGYTGYVRVSGTSKNSKNIIGTVLNKKVVSVLEEKGKYTGVSLVEGGRYYCLYHVIRNEAGDRIGAIVAGRPTEEVEQSSKKTALNASVSTVILIIYTFFALFIFISRWVRYLKRAEDYLVDIGKGEFPEQPLIIDTSDEISDMADIINEMKDSLAVKQKLSAEYEAAKIIQTQLLPDDDAIASLPSCINIHASMNTAKIVGGDLYDFFMIDRKHFGIVIADVSDKGVPAALFMATSKMCIKLNMQLGIDPDEVLFRVNNMLNENNKTGMFVTAWIGILDITDGTLKYASAGHPSPRICRAGNDHFEELVTLNNLVLGGFIGFRYKQNETILNPGDRMFLYTDGLDEAGDPDNGFFGKGRMIDYLDRHCQDSIEEIVNGIRDEVETFVGNRRSFDDLTMLMFEYKGGKDHGNEMQ